MSASSVPPFVSEGVLLFAVFFGPLAFGATEPWSLAILESAIFLMLFLVALSGSPDLRQPLYRTALPAILGIILIALFQAMLPSEGSAPAPLLPFTASASGTRRALLLWCSYAALIWCAPQILSDRAALRRFAWALLILGAVVAFVGILQRGQGNSAYYGLRVIRHGNPFGPYTNYNHAASLLSMAALMGGGIFLSRLPEFAKGTGVGRTSDLAAAQAVTLFLIALVVAGVVMTESRGGRHSLFIAACIGALGGVRWRDGRRTLWISIAILLLASLGYAVSVWANPHLVGWGFKKPVTSMLYRFSMYRSGARMFMDFPVFGVGLGALKDVFPFYQEKIVVGVVEHVHSDWLELLVETGLVGFGILFAGVGAYAFRILDAWRAERPARSRWLMGGGIAAAAAFLLHNTIEFSFQIPANAITFLAILAWTGSAASEPNGGPMKPAAAPPVPLRYSLCAVALLLALLSARPAVAMILAGRTPDIQQRGTAR